MPPRLTTDWTKIFFAIEGRLSPRLERMTRSNAFLDAVAVANGMSRLTSRTVRDVGSGVRERLGLPSSRQVQGLQRSVDALAARLSAGGDAS